MNVISFVKEHPVEVGAGVFAAGLVLLMIMRGGSSPSSSGSGAQAAFLAAQSATAQSGNALAATQIQAQSATAQAQIQSAASVTNNRTWAAAQKQGNTSNVQIAQINANEAQAVAPYAVQSGLIAALGNVASQPGQTVTSSRSDNGFFGLGASSSTSSAYVPNPAASNAASTLGALSSTGLFQGGNYTQH